MRRTAFVLTAGEGRKVWPYSPTRPKAALPVANRAIVTYLVEASRSAGFEDVVVVTGKLGGRVRAALDGVSNVRFVEDTSLSGTARSLATALDATGEEPEESLVLYGDIVTPGENIAKLVERFRKSGDAAASLVFPMHGESSKDWICAAVEDEHVVDVKGHARGGATHRLCGAYVFGPGLRELLTANPGVMTHVDVGDMPPMESELAESLLTLLKRRRRVSAVEAEGFFLDVDKPWHILEANHAVLSHMAAQLKADEIHETAQVSDLAEIAGHVVVGAGSVIGPGVKIRGNLWVGKNTTVTDGAIIGPNVMIGDDCRVSEYCRVGGSTVIGDRCHVTHAAELSGVFFENVYAVHYMEYSGVIGSSADLGAATVCGTLRFDDGLTTHRIGKRKEVPRVGANASYMGDYSRTGVNVILMPGTKIGPYSVIGAGTIVRGDVPDRSLVYVKQEIVRKEWPGPEMYGW